jgi:hypothetical protein
MMPNGLTSFTPFFMVYGAYQLGIAKEAQKDAVDLLEESWDIDITRSAGY